MKLSKSKYCNAIQCNKMLWLEINKKEEKEEIGNESILENGKEVGEVAKNLFKDRVDIEFNNDLNIMINETKKHLEKENVVITEASFIYENNFCSVDILKKEKGNIEIYEVKSSTSINEIYLDDIAYQLYVLKNAGFNVTKTCIIYINSNYVRNKELDLNELFITEDVTDIALSKQKDVENKLEEINKYMENKEEPTDDIALHCTRPYECPYFKYCTKNLPLNNVFNIRRMQNKAKFKFYHNGIISFEDLLNEKLDPKFRQQIEFELYDKESYIDKKEIKKFLDTLSFPLYFLDFESYQQPIPMYDGIKPYMQIPFQYSLHYYEEEKGNLFHKEFLAEANIDPRRKLAEALVNDIPKDVTTIAYNMMFEKMVIKNLANLYPDLKDHLMNIHDNMKDLMIPFKDRHYYKKEMQGSYSIKYVLPALFPDDESLNYKNLDLIHNGSEAMNMFANLGNMDLETQKKVRYSLLKYCELDTFAMVKIWQKLGELYER